MKNKIRTLSAAGFLSAMLLVANAASAQTSTVQATTTTTSAGTVSQFSPDTIMVKTETAAAPVTYSYTKTTTYVDESGAPVSIETVKSGLPVTVYYMMVGDKMVASKVVVRKIAVQAVPVVPAVEESKTTTTTTTTK
jgi:hypothetical protein